MQNKTADSNKLPFWPNPSGYRNIDLGLSRVIDLLKRVGNPHLSLPPTIHIAGTNGKGSTLSFLRAIFEEAGLLIHSYTSPHLVRFNERIVLAGKEITDDFLNKCLNECKIAAELDPQIPVTFFEGITVAAFLAFSNVKADLLLLETGMGGRLDATNILPKVLASVITPISFDHTNFLGNTLEKIATEKAGIIKNNCPVFVGKQESKSLQIVDQQAFKAGSTIKVFGRDWFIKKLKKGFLFEGFGKKIELPQPSLLGEHQIENASLAIACALQHSQFNVTDENIKTALKKVTWPGRLQKVTKGKFHKLLPKNFELYVDGSHNSQGATTVQKFLSKKKIEQKIFVILGMLEDKNCEEFLQKICTSVDHLIAVQIEDEPRSRSSNEISKIARLFELDSIAAKNLTDAFAKILAIHLQNNWRDKPALVLVSGSLYLAGNFLADNSNLLSSH